MTTPDLRSITVLTPAILATASHWCIVGCGIADTRPAGVLSLQTDALRCEGDYYWMDDSNWRCYPCTLQPNGMVVPEPWPVLDGEEEIEEWRGMSLDANIFHEPWSPMWCCYVAGKLGKPLVARPNMHPAPRRGGKWVWENDR